MYESTTKTERNKFVIAHLSMGKSLKEVQQLLKDAGYASIDVTRVWKIWKKSGDYEARRAKENKCTLCLERRATSSMYSIVSQTYKIMGILCQDCWDKRPQPSNE